MIDFYNGFYRRKGIARVYKQHTHFLPVRNALGKVVNVMVKEKAIVDYMGRIGNRPVAFEAKSTDNDRLMLSAVEPHQYRFLDEWTRDGSIGFVIVDFKRTDTYVIPFAYWKLMVETRRKGLMNVMANGSEIGLDHDWPLTGMASVSREELPMEWKIKGADYADKVLALFG